MSLSAKQVGRLKPILFLLGLLPIVRWVWLGINDDLTANPVEFLNRLSARHAFYYTRAPGLPATCSRSTQTHVWLVCVFLLYVAYAGLERVGSRL